MVAGGGVDGSAIFFPVAKISCLGFSVNIIWMRNHGGRWRSIDGLLRRVKVDLSSSLDHAGAVVYRPGSDIWI